MNLLRIVALQAVLCMAITGKTQDLSRPSTNKEVMLIQFSLFHHSIWVTTPDRKTTKINTSKTVEGFASEMIEVLQSLYSEGWHIEAVSAESTIEARPGRGMFVLVRTMD